MAVSHRITTCNEIIRKASFILKLKNYYGSDHAPTFEQIMMKEAMGIMESTETEIVPTIQEIITDIEKVLSVAQKELIENHNKSEFESESFDLLLASVRDTKVFVKSEFVYLSLMPDSDKKKLTCVKVVFQVIDPENFAILQQAVQIQQA